MSEILTALRRAAQAELRSLEASPAEPDAPAGPVDEALAAHIATSRPSEFWLAVVEELADTGVLEELPAGPAAASAERPSSGIPVTVEEALRLTAREARGHLKTALRISADAADELLERPAAALARRTPAEVRDLARLANRPAGELFADIASSWRSSSGYVYAYRPGVDAEVPAESDASRDMAELVAWGEQLLS